MPDSLEGLNKRRTSAAQLGVVVRTMKALAASNIAQFEASLGSMDLYFDSLSLGLAAIFRQRGSISFDRNRGENNTSSPKRASSKSIVLIIGSDQGLVGRFNDNLVDFVRSQIATDPNTEIEAWVVGEQLANIWPEDWVPLGYVFPVPTDVNRVTMLAEDILNRVDQEHLAQASLLVPVFYHAYQGNSIFRPAQFTLLPIVESIEKDLQNSSWPRSVVPQIIDTGTNILAHYLNEYIFVSICKALIGSLLSENAGRLQAMESAQQNIEEIEEELKKTYNRLRQSSIDEELFDVVAGFEAMRK